MFPVSQSGSAAFATSDVDRSRNAAGSRCGSSFSCMLFDVDNTLIDTGPLILWALKHVSPRAVRKGTMEALRTSSPQRILRALGLPGAREAYRKWYTCLGRTAQLLDSNTPAVLEKLRGRGVRLGVVTSSPKWAADLLLTHCDIREYFRNCLVTYGTCRRRKPHPDPIHSAMSKLSCCPDEVLFVGDSRNDVLAAKNAGVCFGLATWGRNVDHRLASICRSVHLRQIRDLLRYAS